MRKIFLDFDDVVFNTQDFVKDYKKIFRSFGISEKLFYKHYYGYPVEKKGRLLKYNPDEHLKYIGKEIGEETVGLKKEISRFVNNTSKYIFEDTPHFLKSFPKRELFLLSYGRTEFQEKKIKGSGIAKYFSKIIVGDKVKSEMVKGFIEKNDDCYFLEDRVMQISDVERNFPFLKSILIKRKEGRYHDKKNKYCEFEAKNLKEAKKIIINK